MSEVPQLRHDAAGLNHYSEKYSAGWRSPDYSRAVPARTPLLSSEPQNRQAPAHRTGPSAHELVAWP
jgi:hypothetical protein